MRVKTLLVLAAALLVIAGCGDATVDDLEGEVDVPETDADGLETDADGLEADAGSSLADGDYSEVCGDAVRRLSEVGDLQAAGDDLDHAISTCESPMEFQAAAADHLDASVSTDPLIAQRCADPTVADDVRGSAICAELD